MSTVAEGSGTAGSTAIDQPVAPPRCPRCEGRIFRRVTFEEASCLACGYEPGGQPRPPTADDITAARLDKRQQKHMAVQGVRL